MRNTMTNSHTYDDPAKALARAKLQRFIQKNVLSHKKARDVRVMCFPGAEVEGEEALEVREIYDPLGIRRENIVGVECVPEVADRLRNANLGMKIVQSRAKPFFMETDEAPFDVISLDYKGQQTIDEALTLEAIASRQLLNPHGVLATTYFGSRESNSMRRLLALRWRHAVYGTDIFRDIFNSKEGAEAQISAVYDEALERILKEKNLDQLRDAITGEILQTFNGGTINHPVGNHFYRNLPSARELDEAVRQGMKDKRKEFAEKLCNVNGLSFKANLEDLTEREETRMQQAAFRFHYAEAENKMVQEGMPLETAQALINSFHGDFQKSYFVNALERYSYTSNKGSPMLVDMFSFTHLPGELRTLRKKLFEYQITGKEVEMRLNPQGLPINAFMKKLGRLTVQFHAINGTHLYPRVHLEAPDAPRVQEVKVERSDYSPSESEKSEIYSWIREGISDEEICNAYNINERRLAAYKAWVTMRDRKDEGQKLVG